jgi:hypothetical protein
MRILVLDDDGRDAELIAHVVRSMDCEVKVVTASSHDA